MIHAASEKPEDDLSYEEMSEVRARAKPHSRSLAVLLLLHVVVCLFVCHSGRKDHL